jgi:hypothetical protein
MVIVADNKRKDEYLKKIKYSSFTDLNKENRVSFMDYETLSRQYESIIEQQQYNFLL